MKLIDLLNEILNEANRGGIMGTGIGSGRIGSFLTPAKGIAGAYKATKKSETALSNVGFRPVTIGSGGGSGKSANKGKLYYSNRELSGVNFHYQEVQPSTLNIIKSIMVDTSNEFKDERNQLFSIPVTFIKPDILFYALKNNDVLYYGKSKTKSKFYVPKSINNNNLRDLAAEDITFLTRQNYNPGDYKVFNYNLTIRP
jgi:hypothetical protein